MPPSIRNRKTKRSCACCRGICARSGSSASSSSSSFPSFSSSTWRRGLLLAIGFVAVVSFVKLWRGFLVVSHSRSDSGNRGKTFVQRTWDVAFGGGLESTTDDADSAKRRFLFVGGLQRSGTTAVSKLLGSLAFTSKLTMTQGQMAQNKPWRVQNMTMEYFYDVVSEGDVEGKFIQDVYPYKYILDIVGRSSSEGASGGSIAEIVRRETLGHDYKPTSAAGGMLQMGSTLLSQWKPYWNMSKAVLVEKTPENILMAPFLERLFGEELGEPVYFLFTLRHPVAWALAIEKWISGALRRLHDLDNRISMWFAVMRLARDHVKADKNGRSAMVTVENFTATHAREVVQPLLPPVGRHTFEPMEGDLKLMQEDMLRHSVHHIGCWLKGKSYDSCRMRCTTLSERVSKSPHLYGDRSRKNLAKANQLLLSQLADEFESDANSFGYSLRASLRLVQPQVSQEDGQAILEDFWDRDSNRFRVDDMDIATLKSFIFSEKPTPGVSQGHSVSLDGGHAIASHVVDTAEKLALRQQGLDGDSLVAFFSSRARQLRQGTVIFAPKINTITGSGKALGGMLQRQHSLIRNLQATSGHTGLIYFDWKPQYGTTLPHCTKGPSTFMGPDARRQYEGWRQYVLQHHIEVTTAVLFLTTPTMAMHFFAKKQSPNWPLGASTKLGPGTEHVEVFASWIRQDFGPSVTITVVTDDIHSVRCRFILDAYNATNVDKAAATLRAMEKRVYGMWADVVLTISTEDAIAVKDMVRNALVVETSGVFAQTPTYPVIRPVVVRWIPFTPTVRSLPDQSLNEVQARSGCLFIGEPHMIAVRSMKWYIQEVVPKIASLAGPEAASLIVVGKNWDTKGMPDSPHVTYAGYVMDSQLKQYYKTQAVFVSPLLNGTGIATKLFNAVVKGMPVVTTPLGLNGFGLTVDEADGRIAVSSDPDGFAKAVVDLMHDPEKWISQTHAALAYLQTNLAPSVQKTILADFLPSIHSVPAAATMLHRRLPLFPLNINSTTSDAPDATTEVRNDVTPGHEFVFINPSVAWVGGSTYLLAARRHIGRWLDERKTRKVWKSEVWVGEVPAAQLGGASARGGTIGLKHVDVFAASFNNSKTTTDCRYNLSASHGESTGPEDMRLFRFRRELLAIFWAHPQVNGSLFQQDNVDSTLLDCGPHIVQPFLSKVKVRGHTTEIGVDDPSLPRLRLGLPQVSAHQDRRASHAPKFEFSAPVPLTLVSRGASHRRGVPQMMQSVEKNWLPFAHGDTLFATWHVYPFHDVVRVNVDTGECRFAHSSSSENVFEDLLRLYRRAPRSNADFSVEDDIHFYGGAPAVEVFEGRDIARPAYYLGIVHATRKVHGGGRDSTTGQQKLLGGRYYDNFFVKIAARAPFPIIAVSARIPLPALPNMFDGQNAPNTSIAFVSGLADLRHDSSGIAVRGAGAPVRVNDGGEGSGINGMRNTEQLKDYLLTYGVGNQESYATQVSQSEVDALFAAMEAVHDAKRSWENKPGDEVKQPPVEELAVSRKFDGVAQQEGNGNPSKHLVLDYQWQDEGSRVRITFNVDGARELSDDAVRLHYTETSLFVSIVDLRGTQRSLSIEKLFGPIRTATMKRSNAQVSVILKKRTNVEWSSIRQRGRQSKGQSQ